MSDAPITVYLSLPNEAHRQITQEHYICQAKYV